MRGLKRRFLGGRAAELAQPLVSPSENASTSKTHLAASASPTPDPGAVNPPTSVASDDALDQDSATRQPSTESGPTSTPVASTPAAASPPPVPLVVVSPATEVSTASGKSRQDTDLSTASNHRRRSNFFSSVHLAKRVPSFRSIAASDKRRVTEDLHEQLYSTYCLSWRDLRAWLVEKFPDVAFPTEEEYDVDGDNYVFLVPRPLTTSELKEIWYLRSDKKKKMAPPEVAVNAEAN